jgi:hypothetical protein
LAPRTPPLTPATPDKHGVPIEQPEHPI